MTDEHRLHIAPNLWLPPEAVVWTFSILAMRGAGKSNTAVVMAEEMHKAGLHWFAIDPKGDWWGIQSSATGKKAGLDVPVFGGEHGNFPIYPDSGAALAELIVDQQISAVIDLSEFTNAEMFRFLGGPDFGEGGKGDGFFARLYKKKNRNQPPTHAFLEEVDEYLPQQVTSRIAKLHYDGQKVSTKGRFRGLGATCATQRPARFHNDVLTQTDSLIAMRNMAPPELKQVELWVKFHGQSKEIVQSLPGLGDGEGWFVSPNKMKVVERVKFRRRETLDTGATPEVFVRGERRPPTLAEIDGAAIEKAMADTIERAKQEDPAELHRKIASLRQELKAAQRDLEKRPPASAPIEKPVPLLDPEMAMGIDDALDEANDVADSIASALAGGAQRIEELLDKVKHNVAGGRKVLDDAKKIVGQAAVLWPDFAEDAQPTTTVTQRGPFGDGPPIEVPTPEPGPDELPKPHQKILDALAWWESVGVDQPTKVQLGFVAGYRVGKKVGGGYGNYLGTLKRWGLIDYPQQGSAALTDNGRKMARPLGIPATTRDLQETIYARLNTPERKVLEQAVKVYPKEISKADLGERAGYSVGEKVGGGYGNILGRLRSLGLIEYPRAGMVVATSMLFLEEAA